MKKINSCKISCASVNAILETFRNNTKNPEVFLKVCDDQYDKFCSCTKSLYDFTKDQENEENKCSTSLKKLIVDKFDEEQIWQQIDLQNNDVLDRLCGDVSSITTNCTHFSWTSEMPQSSSQNRNSPDNLHNTQRKYKNKKKSILIKPNSTDPDELNKSDKKRRVIKMKSKIDEYLSASSDLTEGDSHRSDESSDEELEEIRTRLKNSRSDDADSDIGENDDINFDFEEDMNSSMFNNDDEMVESSDDSDKLIDNQNKTNPSSSSVDDKFFRLSEMEAFLDEQDELEFKRSEGLVDINDDIDIFNDIGSDKDVDSEDDEDDDVKQVQVVSAKKMKYRDYFPGSTGNIMSGTADYDKDESDEESDENEGHDEDMLIDTGSKSSADNRKEHVKFDEKIFTDSNLKLSSFELRQKKLKEKIHDMEEATLADKPWQLSGEVSSDKRPENSLLEETVEFDCATTLPPVITEETTKDLETLILQRIKDKVWDDVERKIKPADALLEYKKQVTLDREKSKKSLSQIYEDEYLQKQQAEQSEATDPKHESIKKSLRELFIKLDALSNFHFTPKPAAPDVTIISNQPSVNMEEVAPVSVSDAQMLAPEEIHAKSKGKLVGETEKTKTDRKRQQRMKKARLQKITSMKNEKQKLKEKLNPDKAVKSKASALEDLQKRAKSDKSVKFAEKTKKQKFSSKAFFSQLQEDSNTKNRKKKLDKAAKQSKNYKL